MEKAVEDLFDEKALDSALANLQQAVLYEERTVEQFTDLCTQKEVFPRLASMLVKTDSRTDPARFNALVSVIFLLASMQPASIRGLATTPDLFDHLVSYLVEEKGTVLASN